jgi:cytoskeletal protein CcmA (bactofilin family)
MAVFKRRKPDETPAMDPEAATDTGLGDAILGGGDQPSLRPALRPDTGLGVPPYRPAAPAKETPMGRPPFPTASNPTPAGLGVPSAGGPSLQAGIPGAGGAIRPGPRIEAAERRTLVVGRGISVQGTVQDAERLVVEGTVEASMIHATELSIAHGGVFKGEVEVEEAEIAGTIDGTLTARGNLIVRASGRVLGTARCRRLQVEDGGQITGRIEMITDSVAQPAEPTVL